MLQVNGTAYDNLKLRWSGGKLQFYNATTGEVIFEFAPDDGKVFTPEMTATELTLSRLFLPTGEVLATAEEINAARLVVYRTDILFTATGGVAIGAHPTGIVIPDEAKIIGGLYDVTTTFTSATDNATIAIHAEGANDIVSAETIGAGGAPWDAGLHDVIPAYTAATIIKTTADRDVTVTVGGEDLTAGVMEISLFYIL